MSLMLGLVDLVSDVLFIIFAFSDGSGLQSERPLRRRLPCVATAHLFCTCSQRWFLAAVGIVAVVVLVGSFGVSLVSLIRLLR